MVDVYPCINIFYYLCGVNSNLYFMDKQEFKGRADNLLERLDELTKDVSAVNSNLDTTLFNSILLVYRYDKELPIWKEMYRLYVAMHQLNDKSEKDIILLQFRNIFSLFSSYLADE